MGNTRKWRSINPFILNYFADMVTCIMYDFIAEIIKFTSICDKKNLHIGRSNIQTFRPEKMGSAM